ncbi:hypothetical protein [Kordiimonas sp. SCSIO 12610]|uniref:hypothetical protein n=1 Tax=Kordiimonas sp. SCSIO 12610 TaxID=2829597 RepID=UPI00210972B2|nr:hypothetical protein [Kordiimonas sp. SCSIO 12610]UTW56190.1 hypothetical protein KFF44_04640 [Kordiimonas sp. SCSIO 12610]
MAKKIAGEGRLKVGARSMRLRLDIGTMMDLEDHFEMGLVPFLNERLPEFRLGDVAVLYMAMTSKGDETPDFGSAELRRAAAADVIKAGLNEAATAIAACLTNTLMPQEGAKQKTSESVSEGTSGTISGPTSEGK